MTDMDDILDEMYKTIVTKCDARYSVVLDSV